MHEVLGPNLLFSHFKIGLILWSIFCNFIVFYFFYFLLFYFLFYNLQGPTKNRQGEWVPWINIVVVVVVVVVVVIIIIIIIINLKQGKLFCFS